MARKVFISFLGTGNMKQDPGYTEVFYWKDNPTNRTKDKRIFVQSAILELYPHQEIDKIIILTTQESEKKHKQKLRHELESIGVSDKNFIEISDISSDLTELNAAWKWFGKLQNAIEKDDIIILDVTHGFRIIPIVFSAAIGYLKRAKNVFIESVLYGVFDAKSEEKPIVDVRDFYSINDWTEGVGRLVDDADAGFLLKIAEKEKAGGFVGLNNKTLLNNIENLTKSFKNVELQKIEENTKISLQFIQESMKNASSLEKQILEMIVEKFTPLISLAPANGKYSKEYLLLQIKLIDLLAQHGLYMQCFTAMREWLGSLGCVISGDYVFTSKTKDEKARRYAEVFVNMLQFHKKEWNFDSDRDKKAIKDKLLPAYSALEGACDFNKIKELLKDITKVRNGFDHGWTGQHIKGVPENLSDTRIKGVKLFNQILENWESIIEKYKPITENNVTKSCLLINLSNHPSRLWKEEQLEAASSYGEVVDIPFPDVDPEGDEVYIQTLCHEYTEKILHLSQDKNVTVHVMGEMTLTHCLVNALVSKRIPCIASTTQRIVTDKADGTKEVQFVFTQFREYR
jgi:CRISPR-associated Csx2 family protein